MSLQTHIMRKETAFLLRHKTIFTFKQFSLIDSVVSIIKLNLPCLTGKVFCDWLEKIRFLDAFFSALRQVMEGAFLSCCELAHKVKLCVIAASRWKLVVFSFFLSTCALYPHSRCHELYLPFRCVFPTGLNVFSNFVSTQKPYWELYLPLQKESIGNSFSVERANASSYWKWCLLNLRNHIETS